MLTATYSPKQIKVEIVHVDNYPHRRGTVVTIRTLDGTRPFKAYTNGDGDTAMTDTTYVPQALLKDITSDVPAPSPAPEGERVRFAGGEVEYDGLPEVAQTNTDGSLRF